MFSSKLKRLCPYLAKGAARAEAAGSVYSIPEAIKSCPYVKELYTGFEQTDAKNEDIHESQNFNTASKLQEKSYTPKLFQIEEQMSSCPCKADLDSQNEDSVNLCNHGSKFNRNCKTDENQQSTPISLYDKKFDSEINTLKSEGRYRKFINIERHMGSFPNATRRENNSK